jgi:TonB family protein
MPLRASLAHILFGFSLSTFLVPSGQQGVSSASPQRGHMAQDELGCITANVVSPVYPREARLAGIQGAVKLLLVIGKHNEVAELDVISGDPLLAKSAVKAVRQWEFLIGGYVGAGPRETEVPLTFTFKIEDPPEPAFLQLVNGKTIRADTVREFIDGVEYTSGGRTDHISPDSVIGVYPCDAWHIHKPKENEQECVAGGGPLFVISAIPIRVRTRKH